jgi:transcriptional antiterminator RfaH
MKCWYVVYTQPRAEWLAREHLERQGFEVFFPRYLKRRSHARKVEDVPSPLFPRYLFAAFDLAEAGWRVIRSTRGVVDLVRNGLDPAPIPERVVHEIKDCSDANGLVRLAQRSELSPGARIRINSGPFAEYEAIFRASRDDERVTALLSLLGRQVSVELPMAAVTPA